MKLSHLDAEGRARMVDVGDKPESERTAVADGAVRMSREAFDLVAGARRRQRATSSRSRRWRE